MPTTHVTWDNEPELHDIAQAVWKARKVVVITGAGISTNSGIPDFRSENGLYSLIQAQFDAAAAKDASTKSNTDKQIEIENLDQTDQELRPTKKRRISGMEDDATAEDKVESEDGAKTNGDLLDDAQRDTEPGQLRLPSPELPPEASALGVQDKASQGTSQPITPKRTAQLKDIGISSLPVPSSPLSSPPQVLFDPYSNLSSRPTSSSGLSCAGSTSQSEDPTPASTPLLTSQSSFQRTSLPNLKGRDLFDSQIWSDTTATSVFYTFVTTLRQKSRDVSPTSSHHFLSVLRDSRKLVRCYTQNIDQLEGRVGLSTALELGAGNRYRFSTRNGRQSTNGRGKETETQTSSQETSQPEESSQELIPSGSQVPEVTDSPKVEDGEPAEDSQMSTAVPPPSQITDTPGPNRGVECVCLHGSLAELRCFLCGRTCSWDEDDREGDTLAGQQPLCPHCAGATAARQERGKRALGVGLLRPDIVLYGEEHPHADLISPIVQHDLSLNPDMLLILGTSMRVHGLRVLVKEFARAVHNKGGKVVFINYTKPAESTWADVIDYWVQSDCDAWVNDLQKRKPALWLPPGTSVEEDAPKPPRVSRNNSSLSKSKRKKADEEAKRDAEQPDVALDSVTAALTEPVMADSPNTGDLVVMPSPETATPTQARKKKVVPIRNMAPKFTMDAKRPAAFRDHKNNGAWLVCNILSKLEILTRTGQEPLADLAPIATPKEKKQRARKSAPGALPSINQPSDDLNSQNTEPAIGQIPQMSHFKIAGSKEIRPRTVKVGGELEAPISTPVWDAPNVENSITSTVKGRKRKRTAWRMVNGVETRVALSDTELESPALPKAPSRRAPPVITVYEGPLRSLPPPVTSPSIDRTPMQKGWVLAPSPYTVGLAPLDLSRTSPSKLDQMLPLFRSPVEQMVISPRFGLDPSTRISNPFTIQQPLIGHPEQPAWSERPKQLEPKRHRLRSQGHRKVQAREDEAALLLSLRESREQSSSVGGGHV